MADTVICMEAFRARDVTAEALAIDARFGASPALGEAGGAPYPPVRARIPVSILPGSPSGALPHSAFASTARPSPSNLQSIYKLPQNPAHKRTR